jgi:hypothetical protein
MSELVVSFSREYGHNHKHPKHLKVTLNPKSRCQPGSKLGMK